MKVPWRGEDHMGEVMSLFQHSGKSGEKTKSLPPSRLSLPGKKSPEVTSGEAGHHGRKCRALAITQIWVPVLNPY